MPISAIAVRVVATATAFHRPPPAIRIATIGTVSATTPAASGTPTSAAAAAPPSPTLNPNQPTIAAASRAVNARSAMGGR